MSLTEKQLELHNKYVTGSKVASVIGISPFKSKYQLFAEMAGVLEVEPISSERMTFGNLMEPVIHRFLETEFKWKLIDGPADGKHHTTINYFFGLVDRLRVGEDGKPEAVVEFKNVDAFQKSQWDDGVPPYYETQVRFYSMIYDLPAIVVALFGGNHIEIYDVPRDDKIEAFITRKCVEFWDDLQNMRFPDPDGNEKTAEILKRLYPKNTIELVDGDEEALRLAVEYEQIRQHEAVVKAAKNERQNRLRALIGEHEGLLLPDGGKVTWKLTKSSTAFDEAAFKAENPDLYEKYVVEKPGYRRMNIKPKQESLNAAAELPQLTA